MDVQIWLNELGLSQYAKAFYQNDIDEAVLTHLSETDLKELGLVSLGHRKKVLSAIKKLRLEQSFEQCLPDLVAENRPVTVLFADIAGFVSLSGKLGAEPTYELLNQYFQTVDDIIERYGGRVDKHIGDNVMGVFGVLVAHKDDPERAVRASVDIREAVAQLGESLNCPLHIHIGVATGQVVASHMGSHIHDEYTVIGPAVNLAARLEGLSGLDDILMSDSAKQAVGDLVLADKLDLVNIKGIDHPMTVWRVHRLASPRPALSLSKFVGRISALETIANHLKDCKQSRSGRGIYVRGEAGLGKTRLLQQFGQLAEQQGFVCHHVTILDFGVGSRRDIFRQLAEALLGLSEESTPRERDHHTQRFFRRHLFSEIARVHLKSLLHLPQSQSEKSLYEAMDNQTRIREKVKVVSQLVRICSETQPRLITLDDLHWIESSTLSPLARFISELAHCPVLFIMASRIEGDPIDPFWWKQLPPGLMQPIDMEPLNPQESWELVHSYTGLDPIFAQNCVNRAEGNPLFLEQLVRVGRTTSELQLPDSLQSLILGRVDRLAPTDRAALQAASVLGQRFTLPMLRYLLQEPAYSCKNLVENFLIRPEKEGYRFSHALIHDGVYFALLKAHRKQLHRAAASWFIQRGADCDLDAWAAHCDRAEAAEAPDAYYQAATAHAQAFRYELAMELAARGLELAIAPADRYHLSCLMAKLVQTIGNPTDSVARYREAAALATTELEACRAWIGVAAGVRLSGGYEEGIFALDRALPLAKREASAALLSEIYYFKGNLCYSRGDLDGCLHAQQQALDYALQVKVPELEARALGGMADAVYASKRMCTAMAYYQRCVEVAHTHGFVQIEMANRHMLASMMRYMHDFSGAITNNERTLETAHQIGNRRTLMYTYDNQGELLTEQGTYNLASQSIESALDLSFSLNNKRYRAYIMQRLARVRLCQGQKKEAKTLLNKALEICHATDIQFVAPRVLGLLALSAQSAPASWEYLRQGDKILSQGCISHNFLWFYRDAIEAALTHQAWDKANHYAHLLEKYTCVERFPWSEFIVNRGRYLAAVGKDSRNDTAIQQLEKLHLEAEHIGLGMSLPMIAARLS